MSTREPWITEPGVYQLSAEEYHADPVVGGSLTSSGARTLLRAPALFDWERRHGRPDTKAFDFGHAAHAKVLGAGAEIAVIPDEFLSSSGSTGTKAAAEFVAKARAAGKVPLKSAEAQQVDDMAAAILAHPIAAALFDPTRGKPEQVLVWRDWRTGIMRRAMLDWLPDHVPGVRTIVGDYKTAASSEPRAFGRSAADFGYHQQDDWYREGLSRARGDVDPAFVFVVQEKTAPYLVTVVELDADAKRIGRERNDLAIDLYVECTTTGEWPGYATDVVPVSLPRWAAYAHEELMSA